MAMYLRIIDGAPVFPYSDARLIRDNRNTIFPARENFTDDLRASYGVFPVIFDSPPPVDHNIESISQNAPVLENEGWVVHWTVTQRPVDGIRDTLKSQTDREYEKRMIGGIIYQGLPVQSSDRAVINIIGANRNQNASRKNVIGGQPVQITGQMVAALEAALTSYTDALGEKRYNLYTAINAAQTIDDLSQIDPSAGWPSNAY